MRALGRTAAALLAAFLAALGLAVGAPAWAESVLRVSMHSDLKIIDPIWTTALISADHGYLVYDTLFALDETLTIKPQMVETWETSPDRLTWTFTLRDGLEWHDGTKVTAADCVASIRRWGARDSMGQMLMSFTSDLAAPDDKTIRLVLKEPYGLVLQALGKTGANVPFMMPRRVAETSPNSQINDATGSGPSSSSATNGRRARRRSTSRTPNTSRAASPPRAWPAASSPRSTGSNGSGSPIRRPR
jgi:peptide/nickel transport system substrate-binding protein